MSEAQSLLDRRNAVVPRGVGQFRVLTAASGSGAALRTTDGREVLDFATGIGVMAAGHGRPEVVAAIREQAGRLLHACIHVATYEPYVALCEKLASLFPHGDDGTRVMLTNSGAESVENAVKIARQATGRSAVLCYTEGFHGRTLLCMTLTSKVGYKKGCGPFAPEVYRLPFPNRYHYGDGLGEAAFAERELGRLRQALVNTVPAEHVAAVIIEPVQGEGGFVPCPPAYLRGLRGICDEHGILLICDEVQSGFGRTGKWAAYEHAGVVPDLSTWAKAMGGGLPIGAVIGRASVMDAALPGTLGGTYGGNPVACASALATIGVLEKEDACARGAAIGARLRERFLALKERCPSVGDVRGLGAMVALEMVEGGDPRRPATELVRKVLASTLERGLLIIPAGHHGNNIRLLVPLTVSDGDLDRGVAILEEEILRHAPGRAS